MLLRNYLFQWILIFLFLLTLMYLRIRITSLEDSNQLLHDAVMQINSKSKKDIAFDSKIYNKALQQDDIVLMYNRVPKTGSTSFVGVVYDLCKRNKFHTLHINITNNMHTLMLVNQVNFVRNITLWDDIKPAFYHGHMAYLNFEKFGVQKSPLYINLLRKPLNRFVSYYYFLRHGDNFRPQIIRKKHGDTKTEAQEHIHQERGLHRKPHGD
ncbi:heparin sulfate O-sulfotransferase-like [Belonocnema kinseyi]|uniref:heparin sulfate O-sulfotransferase-like n=1 Tax=Belonocnema kinseyi TaxID=2817044 RepID=UPI00143DC900|nr:heparin sulfate O-sulfotransferase-like [Belonocnema kinseyi]